MRFRWLLVGGLVLAGCSERMNLGEIPPAGEVYGGCASDDDCAGERCLEALEGRRLCTSMCGDDVDVAACPEASDVGSEIGCLVSGGPNDGHIGYCALLCTDDGECPAGSSCATYDGVTQAGIVSTRFCAPL